MYRTIIGLNGRAGAGKDTAADYLVAHCGFVKMAFADALREEVSDAFCVPIELLTERATKETPTPLLALENCRGHMLFFALLWKQAKEQGYKGDAADFMAEPRSPRWIMQKWGTEYRRAQDETYWHKQLRRRIAKTGSPVVITDVRFDDEALLINGIGGAVWQIKRDSADMAEVSHSSEAGISADLVARVISNNGTVDDLGIYLRALLLDRFSKAVVNA